MKADAGKTRSRELIEKFVEGHYPEDIQRRFHLWLLDPKGRDEKERALENIWENAPWDDPRQLKGSLNNVKRKIGLPVQTLRITRKRLMLRVAAVVIPVLLIAGGWWLADNTSLVGGKSHIAYMEAVAGEKVTLSDLTVVQMQDGILSYPATFDGGIRKVTLEGTGHFEIAKDEEVPFVVGSELLDVRVTGTRFTMSVDGGSGLASVSLYQGGVDVLIAGRDAIPLKPGNRLDYDAATGEVSIIIIDSEGGSQVVYGELIFDNATVRQMLSEAAASRGYELIFDKEYTNSKTYNIKFINNENIEQILGVLSTLTDNGFSYTIKNNRIYIE